MQSQDGQLVCVTELLHGDSDTSINSLYPIELGEQRKEDEAINHSQRVGKALTYARRYTIIALLGIGSGDEDPDAGSEKSGKANGKQAQGQRQPPDEDPKPKPEPPQDRLMTDKERQRFIARVEELAGDVEFACKITAYQKAAAMVQELERSQR